VVKQQEAVRQCLFQLLTSKECKKMKYLAPKSTSLRALAFVFSSIPAAAMAGMTKPLHDVPEQLGLGAFAIDQQWSLAGLIGLIVVVALLAGFSSRDK
jgi:hypothetical protein